MAFSGLGAGTELDPFQITTPSEYREMYNYNNSGIDCYWKLQNDIDMAGVDPRMRLSINTFFDGDGFEMSNMDLTGYSTNSYLFMIVETSPVSIKNIKITNISRDYVVDFIKAWGLITTLTLDNVHLVFNEDNFIYQNYRLISHSLASGCTVKDLIIEGSYRYLFDDVACDIDGIKYRCTVSLKETSFNTFQIGDQFTGSVAKNMQVILPDVTTDFDESMNVFFNSVSGTSVVENSFLHGNIVAGELTLIGQLNSGSIIRNCYIKGSIKILSQFENYILSLRLLCGNAGTSQSAYRIENCYLYLDNISHQTLNYLDGTDNIEFDDLGYSDWFFPSKGDWDLIYNQRDNALLDWKGKMKADYGMYPFSSSELDAGNAYRKHYTGATYNCSKLEYNSAVLCRPLVGVTGMSVGDEYQGTVIYSISGDTGYGVAKQSLAGGCPVFVFGGNTLLGCGEALGDGIANTALIEAVVSENDAFVNWETYSSTKSYEANLFILKTQQQYIDFSKNYFCAPNKNSSLVLNSVVDEYEEKSEVEIKTEGTFSGWDFVNTWEINTGTSPTLKTNPVFSFDTGGVGTPIVTITSIERLTSNTFRVIVTPENTSNFGVDVYEGETLLNTVVGADNIVNLPDDRDYLLTIKSYYIDDVKIESQSQSYDHYYYDQTVTTINIPTINYINELKIGDNAAVKVHGSVLHNGYIYGSPRNIPPPPAQVSDYLASFVRVNINDYSDFSLLTVDTQSELGEQLTCKLFEQVVKIGDYLFSIGDGGQGTYTTPSDIFLIVIDTVAWDYKMFCLPEVLNYYSEPIVADGEYLYISGIHKTYKIDPTEFINAPNKFNIQTLWTPQHFNEVGWVYDNSTQGGYIDFPQVNYLPTHKGMIHSAVVDDEFVYLSFVTGSSDGYHETLGISIFELHKIKKSDMTPVGWCYIPKSTDDMCQTKDWLFFGIELQESSNPLAFGYGWGTYAVRKSDLHLVALPRLHSEDAPPSVQSYASLIFGDYLLDFKTNKNCHVLDITDVENWTVNEPIGKRTLKVVNFTVDNATYNGIPNEAMIDEAGNFHSFLWWDISGAMKFQISGLSFFAVPTMISQAATVNADQATLNGYILNENGQSITEYGFEYSQESGNLTTKVTVGSKSGNQYSHILTNLDDGTYYFRSYAINSEGTGYGEELSFVVANNKPFVLGEVQAPILRKGFGRVVKAYLGTIEL